MVGRPTRGPSCALSVRIRGDAPDHRIIDGCRAAGENRSAFPGTCDKTQCPITPAYQTQPQHSLPAQGTPKRRIVMPARTASKRYLVVSLTQRALAADCRARPHGLAGGLRL